MISFIWGIYENKTKNKTKQNKTNVQNKPKKNKHIDIENRVMVTKGEVGSGEVVKWVQGVHCMVMDGN